MKKFIHILFVVILSIGCINGSRKEEKDFVFLNFKDSLNINALKIDTKRDILILNDSVILYEDGRLIYESLNPKWLFKKTKNKEFVDNEYIYRPFISDIDPPYKIIKQEKSNIFKVIKETDTLNFIFRDFEKNEFHYYGF